MSGKEPLMLKLGANSGGIFRRLGIEEGFRQIAASGFDSVDLDLSWLLPIRWPYTDPASKPRTVYEDMTDEELYALIHPYREYAEKYGLSIGQAHAVDPPFINDPADDARLLHIIKKTIMICGWLECPYLIIHPAHCEYYAEQITPEEEWEANLKMYGECIPYLKKYNVTACLENMFVQSENKVYSSICQCPYEACRYIDTLNDMAGEKRFAFCLDTGHALMVGMMPDRVIRILGHRLETLHINDNDGMWDKHMVPYTGILEWEKFYEGLRTINYRGTLNFELYWDFEPEKLPAVIDEVAAIGRMMSKKVTGEK